MYIDLSSVKLTFSLLFSCGPNAIRLSLAAAAAGEAAVPKAALGHACSSSLLLHKPTRLLTTYSLTCTNSSRDSTEKGKLHDKPKFGKKRKFLSDSTQRGKPKMAFTPPLYILEATPWAWMFWVPKTRFMLSTTDMNCVVSPPTPCVQRMSSLWASGYFSIFLPSNRNTQRYQETVIFMPYEIHVSLPLRSVEVPSPLGSLRPGLAVQQYQWEA